MREYQVISPSLDGILNHSSIVYEGLYRPNEVLKLLDGPSTRGKQRDSHKKIVTKQEREIIQQYFQDLYSIFFKKFSNFTLTTTVSNEEYVMLLAMLQEMIKVKKLLLL